MSKALLDPEIARMIRDAVAHADGETLRQSEEVTRIPARNYADPDFFQKELKNIFRRVPLMLAPSCELPKAGDFKTMDVAGVPVLIVRGQDGTIRSFLNSCTHRGAAVATAQRGNTRRFTCQYHGWTFGQKGELAGVASANDFGAVDKSCMGLKEFPTWERAGLIFVCLDPNPKIDINDYLCGFDAWLAHFNLQNWHFHDSRALPSANWKLAYDATIDYYHVPALHKNSLAGGGGYSNRALYYPCGPHQRLLNPDSRLAPLAKQPETEWPDASVMAGNWSIFPNVTLAAFNGGFADAFGNNRAMMIMQIVPGETVGTSITNQIYLMEQAPAGDAQTKQAVAQFALLGKVVDTEDNFVGFTQQKALDTGLMPNVLFGRNEGGMKTYHAWVEKLIDFTDDDLKKAFQTG